MSFQTRQQTILWMLLLPLVVEGFTHAPPLKPFLERSIYQPPTTVSRSPRTKTTALGDTETSLDPESRRKMEASLLTLLPDKNEREDDAALVLPQDVDTILPRLTLEEATTVQGMPWTSSIDPSLSSDALLYMPFWKWQMNFMQLQLTNLKPQSCISTESSTDFTYNENVDKKARIVSTCFSSDEYRKIRMTYYDSGDKTQVFNSVWYPDPKYGDLPVLGIDLLSFNRKKFLAIVDFQPLHDDELDQEEEPNLYFESLLEPIKRQYPSLNGRMSSKFYDETKFFSQQMIFGRFEKEEVISTELFPAFQDYVQLHLSLLKKQEPDTSRINHVMERQSAYDTYSAVRDPATGLFAGMFGKEWADDFVYNFLFSLSDKQSADAATSRQRPQGQSQQQQQ